MCYGYCYVIVVVAVAVAVVVFIMTLFHAASGNAQRLRNYFAYRAKTLAPFRRYPMVKMYVPVLQYAFSDYSYCHKSAGTVQDTTIEKTNSEKGQAEIHRNAGSSGVVILKLTLLEPQSRFGDKLLGI